MFFLSNDFLLWSLPYFQLFLPLLVLSIAWHGFIFKPQKLACERMKLLEKQLIVGAFITTSSGISGRLLYLFERSLVIEVASGEKVEVLKQIVCDVKS